MTLSQLHHSGYPPSRMSFGCEQLGGSDWGNYHVSDIRSAIRCAFDMGVTVFDTADVYGLGRSEIELSKALGEHRNSCFIITKFGLQWRRDSPGGRAQIVNNTNPQYLRTTLEASLRRLKIDAIPLYLVHWPDVNTPLYETLETLSRMVRQGKILNYGLSNFDVTSLKYAVTEFEISAIECPYNLIEWKDSHDLLRYAKTQGLASFSYGPLVQGLLSGKYTSNSQFNVNDRRHRLPQFSENSWIRNSVILSALSKVSLKYEKSISQCAIRWVLDSGLVDSVIFGAKSRVQVAHNVEALDWTLADTDIQELNQAAGGNPPG